MLANVDKVKQFLERVLPWDGEHFTSIHQKVTYESGATGIPGYPYKTLDAAVARVAYLRRTKGVADVYLPLSSQVKVEPKVSAKGRQYNSAIRQIENMHLLKCFYVDLDVKEGGYPDTISALRALYLLPLPRPNVIVLSGTGGAHCYWTFNNTFTLETWKPRAEMLVALFRANGLHFDNGVSTDPVRLLRVPETLNAKTDPPSPVLLKVCEGDQELGPFDEAIAKHADAVGREPALTPGSNALPPSELSAGIEPVKAALRDILQLEKECPWIAHSRATGGVDAGNAQRRMMMQIGVACDDARNTAWSMMHSRASLTTDEFIEQFDRAEQDREEGKAKWPSCKAIESAGSKQCVGCPHRGGSKGPLSVGFQPPPPPPPPQQPGPGGAQPSLPGNDLPDGYKRAAVTGYILKEMGPGNADDLVLPYKIEDALISPDPYEIHFKSQKKNGRAINVTLACGDTSSEQSLMKALATQGVIAHNMPKVKQFMVSFMQQLQDSKSRMAINQPFGWTEEGGFAYAGKRFTPQGIFRAALPASPDFKEAYMPKGDRAPWMELVRIINHQKNPVLDMLIATAFAAPLIYFTGQDGCSIGAWTIESGAGKSTALKIATSVWGEIQRAKGGLSDTKNQVTARMSALKNLPTYWDEVRQQADKEQLSDLVSIVSEGKGRNRLNRAANFGKMEFMKTILAYTTNESIRAVINDRNKSSPAASMRTFECHAEKREVSIEIQNRVDTLMSYMNLNYGHAGLAYAEYIGTHQDEVHQTVLQVQELLHRTLKFTQDERYYKIAITTILVGAHYANKLGLTEFDLVGLRAFLIAELKKMRSGTAVHSSSDLSRPENIAGIFGAYLREKKVRNTVYTDHIWGGVGKPKKGAVNIIYDTPATKETLQVQIAKDSQIIRLAEGNFRDWLKHRDTSAQTVLSVMFDRFGCTRVRAAILGAGTDLASIVKETLLEFIVKGTELEQYVEWE